jgi:hypothetical protein
LLGDWPSLYAILLAGRGVGDALPFSSTRAGYSKWELFPVSTAFRYSSSTNQARPSHLTLDELVSRRNEVSDWLLWVRVYSDQDTTGRGRTGTVSHRSIRRDRRHKVHPMSPRRSVSDARTTDRCPQGKGQA